MHQSLAINGTKIFFLNGENWHFPSAQKVLVSRIFFVSEDLEDFWEVEVLGASDLELALLEDGHVVVEDAVLVARRLQSQLDTLLLLQELIKKIQKNPFLVDVNVLPPCIKESMISYWTFMAVCWLVSLAVCKGKKVALPWWYHGTCLVQYLSIAIDYLTGKFCLVDVVPAVWLVILRQPPTLPLAQLNNKQGC